MQYEEARSQLTERLRQLLTRIEKIEGDLRHLPDADSAERAVERENDEVLEQLDADTLAEVNQLRLALDRIEAGTYGRCATCGRDVGAARLAALPSATQCVACAT